MNRKKKTPLPVIVDCEGCGVCCLHMGYPAYIVPRKPMTDQEIDADPHLVSRIATDPEFRSELRKGNLGEPHWHSLSDELRAEWEAYVKSYQLPTYGIEPQTFDGPCIWLDPETRQCKHHEHRPRVCRDFEIGSSACRQWRTYYRDKVLLNRPEAN